MNKYKINDNTLAIMPLGENDSLIYEVNNLIVINNRPNNIIKLNCEFFGSSFEGRLIGTRVLTGYTYKAPIIMEEKSNTIFFPTCSPRLKSVGWINLKNVDDFFYDNNDKTSVIKFINGEKVDICSSIGILNNQILRAYRLEAKMRKNKAF